MERPRWRIAINLDSKCNARCSHCCVSSTPEATARLDDQVVDRILDEVLSEPNVTEVGLTGGEPFIRRHRTLSIIKRITGSGRSASCVTNGFWGVTPRAADRTLHEVDASGLRELTLSYDEFHAAYVAPQRIRNVLDASREHKVRIVLNMCVSRTRTAETLLHELGESILGIAVTKYPVLPAGAARGLPDSEFQRRPLTRSMLTCPGIQVLYHNDGNVYPCCSPAIFDTRMTLGRAGTEPFSRTVDKVKRNALLGILQREGLGWFVDTIRRVRPDAPASAVNEVVSACELCALIFRDERSIELIRPQVEAYWEAASDRH